MISLIICSRDKVALTTVIQSAGETIGVPHEVVAIDNSQGKYGICEVYNRGAAQAKFDLLCFMHEDIKFHTPDWGKIVVEALSQPSAGVVGVAGSAFQPKAPGGWTAAGEPYLGINVIQTTGGAQRPDYVNPVGKTLMRAITLDGLWLCCRKHVWNEFKFDTKTFPGFHFYDIDFCVRVATKYTNNLLLTVLIEHFSNGTFDKIWMRNALTFYKKSKGYLPLAADNVPAVEQNRVNIKAMQVFTSMIIRNKLPKTDIIFCLVESLKLSPFNRDTFYLVKMALKNT